MRDIKRIAILLDKLKELWLLYPDLRFVQLIGVITNDSEIHMDLFFIEENKWVELIQFSIDKAKKV